MQQRQIQPAPIDHVQHLPADHPGRLVLRPQVAGDAVGVAQTQRVGHVGRHEPQLVALGHDAEGAVVVGQADRHHRLGRGIAQRRTRIHRLALLPVGGQRGVAFALVLHQPLADLRAHAGGIHAEQPAVEVVEGEEGEIAALIVTGHLNVHDGHAGGQNRVAFDALELCFPLEADGFADGFHRHEVFAGCGGDDGEIVTLKADGAELAGDGRHGDFPLQSVDRFPNANLGERNRAGWRTGQRNRRAVRPPRTARP
ncbi:hypothetical protein D3C85_1126050 [compost metagenome]